MFRHRPWVAIALLVLTLGALAQTKPAATELKVKTVHVNGVDLA